MPISATLKRINGQTLDARRDGKLHKEKQDADLDDDHNRLEVRTFEPYSSCQAFSKQEPAIFTIMQVYLPNIILL